MKIVTLNTWGINEPYEKRIRLLTAELLRLNPDVACFQEVPNENAAERIQENFSFPHFFASYPAGLLILSKQPFGETLELKYQTVSTIDLNDRRAIFASVQFKNETVWIGNTHLAWKGADEATRVGQVSELASQAGKLGAFSILAGDFNCGPDSAPIAELKEEKFTDIFRLLNPKKEVFTWDNDRNPYLKKHATIFPNRRIDLIMASETLLKKFKAKSCEVVFTNKGEEENFPSDHFGVVAEFG